MALWNWLFKIRCNNEVNSRFIAYLLSTAECKNGLQEML